MPTEPVCEVNRRADAEDGDRRQEGRRTGYQLRRQAHLPEKWMPSTQAKATRRSAKVSALLIQRSAHSAFFLMMGTVRMALNSVLRSWGAKQVGWVGAGDTSEAIVLVYGTHSATGTRQRVVWALVEFVTQC